MTLTTQHNQRKQMSQQVVVMPPANTTNTGQSTTSPCGLLTTRPSRTATTTRRCLRGTARGALLRHRSFQRRQTVRRQTCSGGHGHTVAANLRHHLHHRQNNRVTQPSERTKPSTTRFVTSLDTPASTKEPFDLVVAATRWWSRFEARRARAFATGSVICVSSDSTSTGRLSTSRTAQRACAFTAASSTRGMQRS